MTLETFLRAAIAVFYATLIPWFCISAALLWKFRVFSPAALTRAPARQSTVSLVVVGGVILFYLAAQVAVTTGAIQSGLVRASDFGGAGAPGTLPAETAPAPSQTATSQAAATLPATRPNPQQEAHQTVVANAVGAATELLTVLFGVLAIGPMFKEGYRGWGLHPRQIPRGIVSGLLGFVIIYPILMLSLIGLQWLYSHFQHQMTEHSTFEALDQYRGWGGWVILIGMATVVAPVAEEFAFRGLLQTALIQYGWGVVIPQLMPRERLPAEYRPGVLQRCVAILITSLLFARLHSPDHAPAILLLSFALGYVYERTGILWASMALHAAFNSAEVTLYLVGRYLDLK